MGPINLVAPTAHDTLNYAPRNGIPCVILGLSADQNLFIEQLGDNLIFFHLKNKLAMAGLPLRTASQNQLQNRTLATNIFGDRFLKALQHSPTFPLRKETRGDYS